MQALNSASQYSEISSPVQNSLKRQRPRPVISCLECRRKKLKCDRTIPCNQCKRSGRESACAYQDGQVPEPSEAEPAKRPRENDNQHQVAETNSGEDDTHDQIHRPEGKGVLERLEERVALLEGHIRGDRPVDLRQREYHSTRTSHGVDVTTNASGPCLPYVSRHRYNTTVFPHATSFMRLLSDSSGDRIGKVSQDLRSLHYSLKQYHRRPNIPVNCYSLMNIISMLPREDVCLSLSELYFDNLEHCFRILHRDTFLRQLRDFFSPGSGLSQDSTFAVQLLAVICMGALMGVHNECVEVLRAENGLLVDLTVSYLQEYLDRLSSKKYYSLSALQTKMLMLLLRWMRLDKNNDLWRLSGDILRHALILKLNMDPDEVVGASFTPLEGELRRRLWMTIVEQDMMLSILRNMPCMVPDFTTKAPLNINDADLQDLGTTPIVARPPTVWTDSLCQTVLAASVRDRLHACQDLHTAQHLVYEHVLTHTRCFERILENLPPPLRFSHQDDVESKAPSRLMARMELDISIRRPLMHLYSPFAHANDEHDDFSEARAGYLQSCLMLDVYQDLFDPKFSELGVERPEGYWDFFYNLYRSELHQAVSGICLELKRISTSSLPDTPVLSSNSLKVHTYNRASLLHAVKDSLEPMVRRISRFGADLKELSYFTIVFNSVKTAQYSEANVVEALEELVAACRLQLQRNDVPVLANTEDAPTHSSSQWTPGPGNNVSWENLANFPFEFDYGNDINKVYFS